MKQKWKSFVLLLLVCVLVVAAPLGVGTAQGQIKLDESCYLTVDPGVAKFSDLSNADLVADLYQVAKAVEVSGYDTYSFEALEPYAAFSFTDSDWDTLGYQLADVALAQEPTVKSAPVNTPITGLEAGLYLVTVHQKDATDYLTTITDDEGNEHIAASVRTAQYTYLFGPGLIALPTKEADPDTGEVNTANPTDWIYNATITLKPEQDTRLGELQIIKHLTEYRPGGVSEFTFRVDVYMNGLLVDSNVYTIGFTDGESRTITVPDLPVGAEVVVTEVNSGTYHLVVTDGVVNGSQTVVIEPELENVVEFTNAPDDTPKGGGSVMNSFEYGDNGRWTWTPVRP